MPPFARPTLTQPPATQYRGRLIIAVDLGTTRSAVAFATIPTVFGRSAIDPEIRLFGSYLSSGSRYGGPHPTTDLYYRDHKDPTKPPLAGHRVEAMYDDRDRNFEPRAHVRFHKLAMHRSSEQGNARRIWEAVDNNCEFLGKTNLDFFKDWVKDLYGVLFASETSPLRQIISNFEDWEIEVVVAVPPGWDRAE